MRCFIELKGWKKRRERERAAISGGDQPCGLSDATSLGKEEWEASREETAAAAAAARLQTEKQIIIKKKKKIQFSSLSGGTSDRRRISAHIASLTQHPRFHNTIRQEAAARRRAADGPEHPGRGRGEGEGGRGGFMCTPARKGGKYKGSVTVLRETHLVSSPDALRSNATRIHFLCVKINVNCSKLSLREAFTFESGGISVITSCSTHTAPHWNPQWVWAEERSNRAQRLTRSESMIPETTHRDPLPVCQNKRPSFRVSLQKLPYESTFLFQNSSIFTGIENNGRFHGNIVQSVSEKLCFPPLPWRQSQHFKNVSFYCFRLTLSCKQTPKTQLNVSIFTGRRRHVNGSRCR